MGITGLIPFLDKASRRANVSEFSGCTVAIDSYCWLHKGAFACADKLVRGEDTDIHIKYCMKYVTMLLAKNIKPILVFDGRHLPAKAMTEAKRRESRNTSKKRAAELLSLGQVEEARSYIRRSVDITHEMALALMRECRRVRVDCIVAPHEADSQLAHLNIHNYAHCVITEDSDLILFKCTKVLFKMDLEGNGILVDTSKLPLVMRCPIERYSFDKFRQMCIMSGCDYLASLPGIGLAKARQFVNATQDSNFVNALRKLPSFFNKSSITVSDEYREGFLKAEATFKYQYVYDPIEREMKRLNDIDNPEVEEALCVNAGEYLDPETAFQLALGNLDPFTMKRVDNWHPDHIFENGKSQTTSWKGKTVNHPSIWSPAFKQYLSESRPWQKQETKKLEPIITTKTKPVKKVVNLISKYVPETQDESLTIESLSNMYCKEPLTKKQKLVSESETFDTRESMHNQALHESEITSELNTQKSTSPILENRERSYRKCIKNSRYSLLKRLSKFPRTIMDSNVVESKFFNTSMESYNEEKQIINQDLTKKTPEILRNPFKINNSTQVVDIISTIDSQCVEILDTQETMNSSQKENSPNNSPIKGRQSPILESPKDRNPFRLRKLSELNNDDLTLREDSVIENTYPMEALVTPVDSQISFGESTNSSNNNWRSSSDISPPKAISQPPPARPSINGLKRSTCRVPGLKRTASLPSNQPTLLSKFGFQKKPVMKR